MSPRRHGDPEAVLDEPRRRFALACLHGRNEAVTLDDLVDEVLARELVHATGPVDPDEVATTLHHVHLPALEAAGFIRYDDDAETVELLTGSDSRSELGEPPSA